MIATKIGIDGQVRFISWPNLLRDYGTSNVHDMNTKIQIIGVQRPAVLIELIWGVWLLYVGGEKNRTIRTIPNGDILRLVKLSGIVNSILFPKSAISCQIHDRQQDKRLDRQGFKRSISSSSGKANVMLVRESDSPEDAIRRLGFTNFQNRSTLITNPNLERWSSAWFNVPKIHVEVALR